MSKVAFEKAMFMTFVPNSALAKNFRKKLFMKVLSLKVFVQIKFNLSEANHVNLMDVTQGINDNIHGA